MKTAAELLRAYVDGSHDRSTVLPLFAENCLVEAPYFTTLGMPWRFDGRPALGESQEYLRKLYPGLHFENLRIICATDDVAVGEYEFIATSSKTGRRVYQLTLVEVVAADGEIRLLREFQNIAEIALAVLPGGLGDISTPDDRDLAIGSFSSRV